MPFKRKKTLKLKVVRKARKHMRKKPTRIALGPTVKPNMRLSLTSNKLNMDPFPQKWTRCLTYSDSFVLTTPILGVVSEQIFSLNSIYDPDVTNAGHQPLYHDQIAALYNFYLVTGCKLEVTFSDPSVDGMFVYVGAGFTNVLNKSYTQLSEIPFYQTFVVNNTGSQTCGFSQWLDLPKISGLTKSAWMNDIASTGASFGSNPVVTCRAHIGAGNLTSAAAQTINATVKLTYRCVFYGRIVPSQS